MSSTTALRALIRASGSLASGSRQLSRARNCSAFRPQQAISRTTWRAFSQSRLLQEKKYTEQHEWIELEADGSTAAVGITEYAAKALGDVVFVELPAIDAEVSAGEVIGAVESVKSASDIMSPVTGTVLAANTVLDDKPKTINDSPERDGWIAKIKVSDVSELDGLLDEKAYMASLEEEE